MGLIGELESIGTSFTSVRVRFRLDCWTSVASVAWRFSDTNFVSDLKSQVPMGLGPTSISGLFRVLVRDLIRTTVAGH